jgi:hypothetical protein
VILNIILQFEPASGVQRLAGMTFLPQSTARGSIHRATPWKRHASRARWFVADLSSARGTRNETRTRRSITSTPRIAARFLARPLAALIAAGVVNGLGLAATLPTAPKTFDPTYAAPKGATLNVAAGGDLQAALDKAQLGDTIVLQAGATFTGPFRLPNKTSGSGWIYVVSSNLSKLPPPGTPRQSRERVEHAETRGPQSANRAEGGREQP